MPKRRKVSSPAVPLFFIPYRNTLVRRPADAPCLLFVFPFYKKTFAKRDEGSINHSFSRYRCVLPISCPDNDGLSSCPTLISDGNSGASSIPFPCCFAPANSSLKGSGYLLLPFIVFNDYLAIYYYGKERMSRIFFAAVSCKQNVVLPPLTGYNLWYRAFPD